MRASHQPTISALLLAAGAGHRMGQPKALLREPDGTSWLGRSVAALCDGGCPVVTVVLGAAADEARRLVPEGCRVVVADDWASGMGASLRAGLASLADESSDVAVVSLVDLPDVTAAVVERVVAVATGPDTLARAAYDGRPGHPVVLGRHHWRAAAEVARGDRGARDLLAGADVVLVECGDLATGEDVDSR